VQLANALPERGQAALRRLDEQLPFALLFHVPFPAIDGLHFWQDVYAGGKPLVHEDAREPQRVLIEGQGRQGEYVFRIHGR
jgi:hypothetical protein